MFPFAHFLNGKFVVANFGCCKKVGIILLLRVGMGTLSGLLFRNSYSLLLCKPV